VRELAVEGYTTKTWSTKGGKQRTGRPIDQQFLGSMLRNRIYLGEVQHNGTHYTGQHDPIVSPELWGSVHAFIERRKRGSFVRQATQPALLAGMLFSADGQLMIQSYTRKKNGRLYRYYVPCLEKRRGAGATLVPGLPSGGAIPAAEIEARVLEEIHKTLQAPEMNLAVWRACQKHPGGEKLDEPSVVVAMKRIGAIWSQLFPVEQQRIVRLMIERVQIQPLALEITWRQDGWIGLDPDIARHPLVEETRERIEEEVV
jgi:hypothetical protein